MIRNIKGNNLLRKYQNGNVVTKPTVSPNAIAFTSGFETNRGYANNGYTSSTEPRNMSTDYGYILEDVPEPLQVILLDAAHNQGNLPGTMILALAKNNPVLYQKLADELFEDSSNAMQSVMMLRDKIGTQKAYEGKNTLVGLWIREIKPEILKAYNENPKKFIDDFTKSRIERNSSFGNKNTSVIKGSDSEMEEWAERSVAAAEYAKDLIDGDAEVPEYYYDAKKNQNVFKQQIKPIVDFTLTNIFPGDGTENSKEWYNEVNDLYNTETKTIQDTQKNTITQVEEPNLNEVVPNKQQTTTNLPDGTYTIGDQVYEIKTIKNSDFNILNPITPPTYVVSRQIGFIDSEGVYKSKYLENSTIVNSNDYSKFKPYNKQTKVTNEEINLPDGEVLNDDASNPPKNAILDTPASPPNDNYGADKQTVYYDFQRTNKHYIIEDDIKWEVDKTGEKIKDTDKVLSTQEKNKFLTNIFELDEPGDEPVDQRSIEQPTPLRTVGNVLNKGIEKIDKSLRDKNPYRDDTYGPIKDKNKELREERKAARQENQAVRRTGREMKKKFNILEDTESIDQNRLNQSIRAEKKAKRAFDQLEAQKQAGDEKAKRIEGRMERTADTDEFNEEKFNSEGELKLNKIESKQKIKTLKGKNRLNKKDNKREKREKRELEKNKKLEEKALKLEEALEEKRYGGRLKYRIGGNLIKYQAENSTIIDPNSLVVSNLDDFSGWERTSGYSTPDGIAHDGSGNTGRFINGTYKTKAEELEDAINYNKQYSAYDPYSLMRPSHKISNAANQAMTGYNLSLASQAPEKTPLFRTDYTPLRQYAPVDFKPATDQYAIGRRAIANNARGTGTLMGNLQQLNSNILNKKIDIAKRAADSQLGFDRTYETAKEGIAKEFKDQKMNQYYKDLEHKSTKQNAMTEAVSKWNQQQQTKAGYIQAENSDVNKINSYINQLSADYNVRLDENGMAYVVHNKTGKKDDRETLKLNQLRRRNLTQQRGQAMKLMAQATDENDKIKYREEIKSLDEQLKKVGFYSGSKFIKDIGSDALNTQSRTLNTGKRGGNIKSKKTTNVLMDGGYTPRNKRQKKLRTKLY